MNPNDVDGIRRMLWPERHGRTTPAQDRPHVRVVVDGIPAIVYAAYTLDDATAKRFVRRAREWAASRRHDGPDLELQARIARTEKALARIRRKVTFG